MLNIENFFYDNNFDLEEINPYLHNIQLLYNESNEHHVPQREMYNFLILYVVDGEMDLTFADEKVILTAGEFVLIPPKVLYKEVIADGKTCRYYVVSFDVVFMRERVSWDRNELYLKYCCNGVDKAPFDYRYYSESDKNYFFLKKPIIVKDANTEKFCDILKNVLDLHLRRQFSKNLSMDLSIKSYLLKFLSLLFYNFGFQSSSNSNPVISYFINYVTEHYEENFAINEIIKEYGYSPNHFRKIFKMVKLLRLRICCNTE